MVELLYYTQYSNFCPPGTGPAFTDGSPQRLKIREELIMDVAMLLVLVNQMGTCASRPRHHDVKQAHLGMFIHSTAR